MSNFRNSVSAHLRHWRLHAAAFALASIAAGNAAALPEVPATPTAITGTAERMISYRHQSHMWQTEDGSTHVLANVGPQPGGSSMQMFSSADNGITWTPGVQLPDGGRQSTSDGFLAGNNLYVTYSTAAGGVSFALLQYNADLKSWSIFSTETAFLSPTVIAGNPAMARDGTGRYWLTFTAADTQTQRYSIKMLRRSTAAEGWVDTGFVFGPPASVSESRSARPVAILGGMGLVYTDDQNVYWARRANSATDAQPWVTSIVHVDALFDNDPYGGHFSVAVDPQGNVHLAMADGGQLLYYRWLNSTQTWKSASLGKPVRTAYMQILAVDGNLMLVYNNKSTLGVLQSSNVGKTWFATTLLTHPPADATNSYGNPRMEAPANANVSPVPVLQQYIDSGLQRLMSFQVPVVRGIVVPPNPLP